VLLKNDIRGAKTKEEDISRYWMTSLKWEDTGN
jgi:hypothetical protein